MSAIPVADGWPEPLALNSAGLQQIKQAFVDAARRALEAGFIAIELHMARGYLLHSFYLLSEFGAKMNMVEIWKTECDFRWK